MLAPRAGRDPGARATSCHVLAAHALLSRAGELEGIGVALVRRLGRVDVVAGPPASFRLGRARTLLDQRTLHPDHDRALLGEPGRRASGRARIARAGPAVVPAGIEPVCAPGGRHARGLGAQPRALARPLLLLAEGRPRVLNDRLLRGADASAPRAR